MISSLLLILIMLFVGNVQPIHAEQYYTCVVDGKVVIANAGCADGQVESSVNLSNEPTQNNLADDWEKMRNLRGAPLREMDKQKAASRIQSQFEREAYTATSSGTAWLVKHGYEHRSYAVTNFHVVADRYKFTLITPEGRKLLAKVILRDKENDLAVLEILEPYLSLPKLPLAEIAPELGTKVFTIGYPHPGIMGATSKLTDGVISSLNGYKNDPKAYQISVPVHNGNSGGPLLNMRGEVVGVVQSKLNAAYLFQLTGDLPQNVNYAIKAEQLRTLLRSIPAYSTSGQSTPQEWDSLEQLARRVEQSVMLIVVK